MGTGTTGMDSTLGNLSSQAVSVHDVQSLKRQEKLLAHDQSAGSSGEK